MSFTLAGLAGAIGALLGALNPFDWILIGLVVASDVSQLFSGDVNLASLALTSLAGLALIALMRANLPESVLLFLFVAFWTLTMPNILSTANTLGIAQYFTLWGIPLLSVAFFLPYLALAVYFMPMILGYYRLFGLYN